MKRLLFLWHRWLGLAGCLLMVLWFASAFIMMYVQFPGLGDSERLARLAPLSVAPVVPAVPAVPLAPAASKAQAARQAPAGAPAATLAAPARALWGGNGAEGVGAPPPVQRIVLRMVDGRPVYVVQDAGGWRAVSALAGGREGGEVEGGEGDREVAGPRAAASSPAGAAQALRVAAQFAGVPALEAELIEVDQWSVSASLDAHRPLWAVAMADGGLHYVSSRTGEVVRDSSRTERWLGWPGAVVHWIYPTVLRRQSTLWHWVVVGLSSYALLTALLGTVVGLLRWRPAGYARGNRSPYRGLMWQHHVLGLAGALVILAWLLSGLLSMNPFGVFSRAGGGAASPQATWGGALGPRELSALSGQALQQALARAPHPVSELEILPALLPGGAAPASTASMASTASTAPAPAATPLAGLRLWLRGPAGQSTLLSPAGELLRIDESAVREATRRYTPAPVAAVTKLEAFDAYYYARHEPRPLPVWRVVLADPQQTWLHVDATTGRLLGRLDTSRRAERWLYNGLHSWDLNWLLAHRPVWDIAMLAALLLGSWFSVTSVVLAWRRLAGRRVGV